jgi:hypothetical protein
MNTMSETTPTPSREELNATLEQLFNQANQLPPDSKQRAIYGIAAAILKVEAMRQNNATVAR